MDSKKGDTQFFHCLGGMVVFYCSDLHVVALKTEVTSRPFATSLFHKMITENFCEALSLDLGIGRLY